LTDERVIVRRGTGRDIDAVLELWGSARSPHASTPDHREALEALVNGPVHPRDIPDVDPHMRGPTGDTSRAALFVAEAEGRLVGAVIAGWDGWRGNLYRLAVGDRHRREGIGLQLTRAAEDHLRACGARRITALVADDDGAAGAFWDAAGYPRESGMGRRVRNL
jgi:ribosomal protein S18 acetylase RimI-like enzyme